MPVSGPMGMLARYDESDGSSYAATRAFYGHESIALGILACRWNVSTGWWFSKRLAEHAGWCFYPQGGAFNRTQAGQMPMMPGYNPYQQPCMPQPPPQGPPPHAQPPQ
ncbi:hypothetical protein L484_020333 [Morus notabilis]|uniref:Uncharacterized protein n=1 Tax=Morus notabilis TaxID=981085 RepID=W9RF36_9ROSA|nr:hypothetical protein L484_020333 [Morus notabilis]